MATRISKYNISELSCVESKNQIIIETNAGLIYIEDNNDNTKISFPFGNHFTMSSDDIMVYKK